MIGYENNDGNGREAAFRKAMEKFGLPLEPELMMQGLFNEKVAYNNVRVLIGRQERLPDAIVCASDEMAIGCMNAIHDMGMEVPGDVSVLGFDNLAIGEMCEPKLTTVDYDISRFCRMAGGAAAPDCRSYPGGQHSVYRYAADHPQFRCPAPGQAEISKKRRLNGGKPCSAVAMIFLLCLHAFFFALAEEAVTLGLGQVKLVPLII